MLYIFLYSELFWSAIYSTHCQPNSFFHHLLAFQWTRLYLWGYCVMHQHLQIGKSPVKKQRLCRAIHERQGGVGRGGGIAHLIWRQRGKGLDDGGEWHLRLLGHVGCARHVVGRTADKPGTGVPLIQTQFFHWYHTVRKPLSDWKCSDSSDLRSTSI